MTEALVGLGLMMVLALLRIPIAFSMGIVGFLGVAYLRDWNFAPAMAMVETKIYETGRNYTLSVIPLFILMGNLVTRAGMSQELFRAAYAFIGHLRGGLAMATIVACAGFGAICGSSIATAATMAKVAYPSMRQLGYSDRLSTGAIASGGTLGILIPPSTLMVIYGVMTETNIGKMFAAGILPGILATFLLCLAVQWTVWRDPASGPRGERATWRERLKAAEGVWAVALLFVVVMGGIYGGVFTATEGAGIGAVSLLTFAPMAGVLALSGAAGLGAVVAFALVYGLARRRGLNSDRLVLIGFAVWQGGTAIITFIVVSSDPWNTGKALTWLSGSTYGRTAPQVLPVAIALLIALPVVAAVRRELDLLALDDDTPRVLGVRLERARLVALGLAALLTATAVSAVGVIGFVGLVAPHAARALVGGRHTRVLPVAVLLGATLVSLADTLGRSVIAPAQVPAGLVTAMIGTPYFVWLLWRSRAAAAAR